MCVFSFIKKKSKKLKKEISGERRKEGREERGLKKLYQEFQKL